MVPRARKKFGAPMFEPEVFPKQMQCFEKYAHDIVVTFWQPVVNRRPGNCAPFPPSLRLWWYAIKTGKFTKINKFSSPNVMNFYSMNICNFRTQYGVNLAQTANKGYCRHFRFLRVVFCVTSMPAHTFFRRGPVLILLIIKLFRHSTSYFFKVR